MSISIVTTPEQYSTLVRRMGGEECILTPLFRDIRLHPRANTLLCVGITFFNYETYVVSMSHQDAPQFDCPSSSTMFVSGFRLPGISSRIAETILYSTQQPIPVVDEEYTPFVKDVLHTFSKIKDAHRIVPLTVWADILHRHNTKLLDGTIRHQFMLNTPVLETFDANLNTLYQIEENGIAVNEELFKEKFPHTRTNIRDGLVYSHYNMYTTTTRPSNRFGGVNYSALNKSDGSRDVFISRYESGTLVQFDFDAYHIRLLANLLDVKLPSTSFHTEMAKLYFKSNDVTDEIYTKSKQLTFELMYGLTDETHDIELFEKVKCLRNSYKDNSTLTLATGITLPSNQLTENKQFNYYVQSLEAQSTIPKLQVIQNILKNTTNHIVLYTYDSVLLDMHSVDMDVVGHVQHILEEHGKFPVHIHHGKTYGQLERYT